MGTHAMGCTRDPVGSSQDTQHDPKVSQHDTSSDDDSAGDPSGSLEWQDSDDHDDQGESVDGDNGDESDDNDVGEAIGDSAAAVGEALVAALSANGCTGQIERLIATGTPLPVA